MMFKLNEQLVVIGKGTNLKAHGEEVILHEKLPLPLLKDIAKSNKIQFTKSAKAPQLFELIETHFKSLEDIKIMNEATKAPAKAAAEEIDQKYIDIVKNGFDNNQDEDDILVALVSAGLKFKAAGSTFKKITQQLGLKISAKERTEQIAGLLKDFTPSNYDEVEKAVAHIVENVKDTTAAQALAQLRKICKEKEVEFPKKPKGKTGDSGPRGFKKIAYDWIVANKEATKEELQAFLEANEQRPVYVAHYWDLMQLCRKFAS